MAELANQEDRIFAWRAVIDAGVRNVEVEQPGDGVGAHDYADGCLRWCVDAGVDTRYVDRQQTEAGIKDRDRVLLQTTNAASEATIYKKRSKALPIVILLVLLVSTAFAASIVDNAQQRRVEGGAEEKAPDARTAPALR